MPARRKPIETVAFVSLGCPKNLVDSERMLGLLAGDGLSITPDATHADTIVINTCGFLEASKQESLGEIRQAVDLKKSGRCQRVVVAGCLVQRHKTELLAEVPGIDRLVGVFDREHIVEAVRGEANPRQGHGHYLGKYHDLSRELAEQASDEATKRRTDEGYRRGTRLPVFEDDRARLRLTPRHFAYLRMSEGCNQGCSFCTIPSIRGPMRSKPLDQIMLEAKELAADGAVELNLIGQDTTSYGTDIGYQPGLAGLLRALDKSLPDVHWLRLMYAYPSCFSDEMIRAIADCGRVVKYIDMPLQHIDDAMLTRMKRRVTRAQVETLLGKLRDWIPGITIRTTFIAGAPGETDAQHDTLVQFVRDFGFDMMGVFPFSPEPGTPMGRMSDQVSDGVKQARVEELMLAQQEIAFANARRMVGRPLQILVDRAAAKPAPTRDSGRGADRWIARHQGQAPEIDSVVHVTSARLHPGQLLAVNVTDVDGYDLLAEVPRPRARSLKVLPASGAGAT